jgi:predicted DNA-binding transcriptional regulator YafY
MQRLIETIVLLLNRETVRAQDLADRFGVSTRTIYRDVEELSLAGVPIYMTKGRGGGISLMREFALNRVLLSDQDKESIVLALRTLQTTRHPEVDSALERIGALIRQSVGDMDDWVQIDFSQWGSDPDEAGRFSAIKQAILHRCVIAFDYVDSAGSRTSRAAEPMRLIYKGRAWYLYAYCRLKSDFRVFRLSRIKGLVVQEAGFQRRSAPVPDGLEYDDAAHKPVSLRLRFSPDVLHRVYDDFDERQIARNPDGTCDVATSFPEDEWVYGYILSFGRSVEVLEPLAIREIISRRLREAAAQYE